MVVVAALLDTLPTPSADMVDKVYQQQKDILSITAVQQVVSSLQHWVEVSISTPDHSKARWQKSTQEPPEAGTVSSPVQILAHDWLSHLDVQLEPQAHHQKYQGDEDGQSQHRA
jgi:hypothetical protein